MRRFVQNSTRTRRTDLLLRGIRALGNRFLGRVGMPVCLRGHRETLYPRMSRRAIRAVAETICRTAAELGGR
jgi:hypothetical protein